MNEPIDLNDFFQARDIRDKYGYWYRELRAKLSCGCWGEWTFDASSHWDFVDEAQTCATHGERQYDLTVQAAVMSESFNDVGDAE